MANLKISQLNSAAALTGSEVVPIVQSGATVKATVQAIADLAAGGGGLENIVYADLYTKVTTGTLTPGQWYRLTDYKSVNFLNGWTIADQNPAATDPNFNPRQIHVGDPEVLLLQAVSAYEISPIGYSETYQGDIIQYEAYTNKIGVDLEVYNGATLPNSSTVSGFDLQWDGTNVYFNMPAGYPALFGHYLYLYAEFDNGNYYQDGLFDPITPNICYPNASYSNTTDYLKPLSKIRVDNNGTKVILLDLTESDYNNYDADSLYVDTVYAIGDAYGWITRRHDTFTDVSIPFDYKARKYRRFEVNLSSLNASLGTGYYGQGDNYKGQSTTGNYKDYILDPTSEVGWINWYGSGGPDVSWYRGFNDNVVFSGDVVRSTLPINFINNTFIGNFRANTIYCPSYGNTALGFSNNNISESGGFLNNLMGNFIFNIISVEFQANTVLTNFQYNNIKTTVTSINFASATHVYGDYNCDIFKRSNGTIQLSYVDGTNTVQYTAVNA